MMKPIRIRMHEAGAGLVTAIFLLVVLAGLGVAAVTLFNAQQASSSLDQEGAKAYQAARGKFSSILIFLPPACFVRSRHWCWPARRMIPAPAGCRPRR